LQHAATTRRWPLQPQPPRGIVVLDGFIQPGFTFLADTGSASTKLPLAPSTEFDAGGFYPAERHLACRIESWRR